MSGAIVSPNFLYPTTARLLEAFSVIPFTSATPHPCYQIYAQGFRQVTARPRQAILPGCQGGAGAVEHQESKMEVYKPLLHLGHSCAQMSINRACAGIRPTERAILCLPHQTWGYKGCPSPTLLYPPSRPG